MNYSHSYHAGNFADVFKHAILVSLIEALQRKDNGFCYIDTHAGAGLYDLFSDTAQKTKEYASGIGSLLDHKMTESCHASMLLAGNQSGCQLKTCWHDKLMTYLTCIKKANPQPALRYYPGSPYIAQCLMRPQDRMVLSELHPKVYRTLKDRFASDKRVSTHSLDGYQSLKAFLPPKERRGLILIDPPYEQANEFNQLVSTLPLALKRFATGAYAIWYPIKDRPPIERFYKDLRKATELPILIAELSIYPETSAQHLNGCGMVIINPPWQLDDQIKSYLPQLWSLLSPNSLGQQRVFILT
jgi:23S rRNA (adenine2030-N6)-methyltransferase